ncbi:protein LKAAEAR1 [Macrotis lagotis]|uniref:protein LKAAEAR1 n=1 Tax=Macrotis lagotis TaxID=92651 RepID=UPI003D6835C8
MTEPQMFSEKEKKLRKSTSKKREREMGKREQEASAEKTLAGNKFRLGENSGRNPNNEWKKLMTTKMTGKCMVSRYREDLKVRNQCGKPGPFEMTTFLKKYPGNPLRKDPTSFPPVEAKRYLLFVEPGKVSSGKTFESNSSSQENTDWGLLLQPATEQEKLLFGVLKASEARNRIRALRLRYIRMRAEEIKHLISRQKTAAAAIRLEIFLPPHLSHKKIPDCLDRRERARVEVILQEDNTYSMFR